MLKEGIKKIIYQKQICFYCLYANKSLFISKGRFNYELTLFQWLGSGDNKKIYQHLTNQPIWLQEKVMWSKLTNQIAGKKSINSTICGKGFTAS